MKIDYSNSIIDIIFRNADLRPERAALIFDEGTKPPESLTYRELTEKIRIAAGELSRRGLAGRHIGLLFSPGLNFVIALLACLATGAVAVPIAPIGRRQMRAQNISRLLMRGGVDNLIFDAKMSKLFGPGISEVMNPSKIQCVLFDDLAAGNVPIEPISLGADRLAVLQFTSGTISHPKGVMITHGNIIANETMIKGSFGHDCDSHFVGWVPHYHDQGLFGNILQPLFLGSTCVLTSPQSFVSRPLYWLELISRYRAHTSGGPNFGYDLCTDYAERRGLPDLDLSSWRVAFNGAERVRPSTLRRFVDCFSRVGFDSRTFLPCYGLAECTLVSVAMPPQSSPVFHTQAIDGQRSVVNEMEKGSEFVCCGPQMEGSEAIVVDPVEGRRLDDGEVGEIWLGGEHVAAGYWNDPEGTEQVFGARLATGEGPYLRTGDLAFARPEGMYIVGRMKDLIVVRGRNYAPSDVEQIWSDIFDPTSRSAAVQIEVQDKQHVVLVAEVGRSAARSIAGPDIEAMAQDLRGAVIDRLELRITDLVLVAEGAIPRTTSGKIRRAKVGEMILEGALTIVGAAGPLATKLPGCSKQLAVVTQ